MKRERIITPEFLASGTLLGRFWQKVEITQSCWLWIGGSNGWSAQIRVGDGHNWSILIARLSWIIHRGPIPEGMNVCHDCPGGDNPRCVNPDHLWLGTQAENVYDLMLKDRRPEGYAQGENNGRAKLTVEQVLQIRKMFPAGRRAPQGSYVRLAQQFNVTASTIQQARCGRHWKDL